MARAINKLSARKVASVKNPGRYSDGGNLYLFITPNGGKRWTFLYRFKGKQHELGLGSAAEGQVSLAEARERAAGERRLLSAGADPLTAKKARKQAERVIPSFAAFAAEYLASHRGKWRNEKHAGQWQTTIATYCGPIRSMPVNVIDTEAVLKVLQPIWTKIPETASRLRGRVEAILDAAKAKGLRTGDNPARWRGHLKTLLPARQRLTRGHHAAMPYDEVPGFMAELRDRQSLAARALELCILTATRTSEVLKPRWSEFDLGKALWIIPASRMKAAKEHRIPLSRRAVAILKDLHRARTGEFVFPGNARGKPMSSMAMSMLLRRMGREKVTVHGFRSSFRDWAAEQTSFPHQTAEHALAHGISDKSEASYRRGDELEKRRKLMESWAAFCEPRVSGKVVRLRRQ